MVLYEDIFTKGLRLPLYKDRNRDYWLCSVCLMAFVKDHLHLWVIMKRKEGMPDHNCIMCVLTFSSFTIAKEKVEDDCW